jgi:hypothetical protein
MLEGYMGKPLAAPESTPPSLQSGNAKHKDYDQSAPQRNAFLAMALNMSWQLAVVVLVPVIGGVQLDKALSTHYLWTFIGLGLALVGSAAVMWRAMQTANSLPVPKLTAAQKRRIQQQYEEDDADV